MIQKRTCSLSTQANRPFYDMVQIRVIIKKNVNIFTIYETLFENVITILPLAYQIKTKIITLECLYNLETLFLDF